MSVTKLSKSLEKLAVSQSDSLVGNEEAPPSYQEQGEINEVPVVPAIPPLELKDLSSAHTVDKDRCILHLKLLAALADLRAAISGIDGLFGISDSQADESKFSDEAMRYKALVRIREKRWAVYTARAADRYSSWWTKAVPSAGNPVTVASMMSSDYSSSVTNAKPLGWTMDRLPPLDVLMVWHSHMLNPRAYLEDCIRGDKMPLYATDFPWKLVDAAIDSGTFDYDPGEEAKQHFVKTTGQVWENLDEPEQKQLSCLVCSARFTVPWTSGGLGSSPDSAFEDCTGYADKAFLATCQTCGHQHDNHSMRVARFQKDVNDLLSNDRPMPGTYLDFDGMPTTVDLYGFPNHILKAARPLIVSRITPGSMSSMTEVKIFMESLMKDFKLIISVNGARGTRLMRTQKISIRRMMSRYWENSSIFALDLVGAVIRQGTFIQKMDNLDWVHSPAIGATMDRLIRKYEIFFDIMVSNPREMAVPTLDVDLAWHTHQMSPLRYSHYSRTQSLRYGTQTLVDHDDKVDEGKLSDAFQWTTKQYKKVTNGDLYSECTCWYCEATRESVLYPAGLPLASSATKRSRTLAENLHDDPRISSDPDKNPHISAHNAVPADSVPGAWSHSSGNLKTMRLRQAWEKSHRRALKREKKMGVVSNNYSRSRDPMAIPYYPMVYGYPLYFPFYAPYMADPAIYGSVYACNPACMNGMSSAYGNCAAGTCGSGVAAGGCAGAGGCGGGACGGGFGGGGCGGGGFGGGCGGGGGGCGGGGGG